MAVGDEVPGVVVAWGATLLTGAGLLAVLPPGIAALLAWPGFLLSPVVALLFNWYGFDRVFVSAFAVAAFAVGVVCRATVGSELARTVLSPDAVFRLRIGLPLLVLILAHYSAEAIVGE